MNPDNQTITSRADEAPIAFLSNTGQTKSVGDFISDVYQLAEMLPANRDAINFCANRYRFLVAFFALCVNGQRNFLPPSRAPEIHSQLLEDHTDLFVIRDELTQESPIEIFDFTMELAANSGQAAHPKLRLDHICAHSYTSGSTGKSKLIQKPWRTIRSGADINAKYFVGNEKSEHHLLATVPAQHLWGFETSVMLPLVAPICVSDEMPFYPLDVKQALERLSAPRILVTTPTHLSSLIKSGLSFPRVERILCATSPLMTTLAQAAETLFDGQLIEIYGCTEMGSLAYRNTASSAQWTAFDGFNFSPNKAFTQVTAGHVEESAEIQDSLIFIDDTHFELKGRAGDLINVGGKRGSIAQVTQIIQSIPDIEDATVFMPEHSLNAPSRPAALVVCGNEKKARKLIREAIRKELDPVFIPRPIKFVSSLPRNETGKLTKSAVQSLFSSLLNENE